MASSILKVGAAQFASEIGDVDANMDRHLEWIARGREAGLDLLVLPEVSLTGHHGPDNLLDAAMRRPEFDATIPPEKMAAALSSRIDVEYAEPVWPIYPAFLPNDPHWTPEGHAAVAEFLLEDVEALVSGR